MGTSFTKDQQLAIDTHGSNILVSAAAGSGKTAVLVERIIKMITEEENTVDIDKLLVVTFTKLAAGEMRERISNALNARLLVEPENKNLIAQLALLKKASITTIDAFCSSVVKKNFQLTDIDPNFRIADEGELGRIKKEVLDELLEECYAENSEGFKALVETYATKLNDNAIAELILKIYNFSTSTPYPIKWIEDSVNMLNPENTMDIYSTEYGEIIKKDIDLALNECTRVLEHTRRAIAGNSFADNFKLLLDEDTVLVETFKTLLNVGLSTLHNAYPMLKFVSLPRNKPSDEEEVYIKETVRGCHDIIKGILKKDIVEKYFTAPLEREIEIAKSLYPIVQVLGDIVIEFSRRYKKYKQELMQADFNDIAHYALDILIDSEGMPTNAAKQLQETYYEVITDEYQDSNYIQELILSAVSKNSRGVSNRFMVGDIKQCIYRFRLVNPEIFTDKQMTYPTVVGKKDLLITLSKNFRSRDCVLEAINFMFYQLMSPEFGNETYDERSALHCGADYPSPKYDTEIATEADCYIIDTASVENDVSDIMSELNSAELEANLIADKITEMLKEFNVYDRVLSAYRLLRPSDITILLRSPKNTAGIFENILNAKGLPAIFSGNSSFFDCIEVKTMLALIKVIDNPLQDIPLITVLHSPIFNITCDELTEIKANSSENLFFEGIKSYIEKMENTLSEKLTALVETINVWRGEAVYTPVSQFVQNIYTQTNYFNYVGVLQNGAQRQGNLQLLIEQAVAFEETGQSSIFNFLQYIAQFEEANSISSAKVSISNENAIRIMSVHQSKGLEFPVVIVAQLGKKFNQMDLNQNFLLHQKYGFGSKFTDYKLRTQSNTISRAGIHSVLKMETLSEELRIMYVALTRAKEKLILVGSRSNLDKKISELSQFYTLEDTLLPIYYRQNAGSFLDWILATLIRHKNSTVLHTHHIEPTRLCKFINSYGANWHIEKYTREDISRIYYGKTNERLDLFSELKRFDLNNDYSGSKNEIAKLLSWQFPNKRYETLPSSISISEIKRQHYKEMDLTDNQPLIKAEIEFAKPQFMLEKAEELTGAHRGTAYHTLLEHINFKEDINVERLRVLIDSLVSRGILTNEQARAINLNKIMKFITSPIGKRLKAADKITKEAPFVMGLRASDIYSDAEVKDCENIILVHGIIDIYFYEGDNIILLDYKTDYVPEGNADIIKERYKIQLQLYKQAIERNTGKSVTESYLYLFGVDEAVKL